MTEQLYTSYFSPSTGSPNNLLRGIVVPHSELLDINLSLYRHENGSSHTKIFLTYASSLSFRYWLQKQSEIRWTTWNSYWRFNLCHLNQWKGSFTTTLWNDEVSIKYFRPTLNTFYLILRYLLFIKLYDKITSTLVYVVKNNSFTKWKLVEKCELKYIVYKLNLIFHLCLFFQENRTLCFIPFFILIK